MSLKTSLSVPASILATARFAAAPPVDGGDRPSGSGLTGNDIMLLWLVLSHAANAENGVTTIPILQRDIGRLVGRIHTERLAASLSRLRGTDMFVGRNVMPCIVGFDIPGDDPRTWVVRIDSRARALVDEGRSLSISLDTLKSFSGRYSVVLLGRFVSWRAKQYPEDRKIAFGAHPKGRAFEMSIPLDLLPNVFGYYDALLPSEIKKLLLTTSPRCTLKRELLDANVLVDTVVLADEISPSRFYGLKMRISEIMTEGPGLSDLNAADNHRRLQRKHGQRKPIAVS